MAIIRRGLLAVTMLLWSGASGFANPPPPGSEDDKLLSPYSDQITDALVERGPYNTQRCCNLADGTAVEARMTENGWQVKFLNDRFKTAPKGWVDVPADSVLHKWRNPTGVAIVWFYHDIIRCFAPPAGT